MGGIKEFVSPINAQQLSSHSHLLSVLVLQGGAGVVQLLAIVHLEPGLCVRLWTEWTPWGRAVPPVSTWARLRKGV